ncbi:alpha/beta hydrolase [Algibacter sp. 2305UL17-15]|uniref:alpha/beta fold hydrolase n=1 Tax=Algibacter sp. 2305UL17-15 TaxID=3231268 RepID=UPI0034596AF7
MKKKNITIKSLKIAYFDNDVTSSIAIVFVHGNSSSGQGFKNQFNNPNLNNYRLVALDLPGHGNSDSSTNYSVPLFVNTIVEFCNALKLANFIIVGHSLGGHFTIQSLPRLNNCIGALVFGTPPVKKPLNIDEAFLQHPVMPLLFKKDLNYEDLDLFTKSLTNNKNVQFIKKEIKTTDSNFREQLARSIQNGDMPDEVAIIESLNIPIALLCGKGDVVVSIKYINSLSIPTLWKNELILIEKTSHYPQLEAPELFGTLLLQFIDGCHKNR